MFSSTHPHSDGQTPLYTVSGPVTAFAVLAVMVISVVFSGCSSGGFDRIDRDIEVLLDETSASIGAADGRPDAWEWSTPLNERVRRGDRAAAEVVPTANPPAEELPFTASRGKETDEVISRLDAYQDDPAGAIEMDLNTAFAYATQSSREFRFAEEEYVIAGLRLLMERHRWGPRFFDDVTATLGSDGEHGLFDTSFEIVNELRVTQRLPYGGTVSARALARATEDLHLRVAGERVQSAELILEADIPLLRGAGLAAREDLIQRSRDLIYAAREFEDFRREFLVSVAEDFLSLVVNLKGIESAELQVEGLSRQEERQIRRSEEGREPPFEAALAQNATIRARDNLNQQRERYRLALDRFKVRLGMPVEQSLVIVESTIGLPIPETDIRAAVLAALTYRLDLQTSRDRVDDARRDVEIARNMLLPDFDLTTSVSVPTDDTRDRAGVRFDAGDADFRASARFSAPLDRRIERLSLRESQIRNERQLRSYDQLRDSIAVDVRGAVRSIDSALFSLQIQERGIEIAELRKAALEADPAAATARDFTEAEESLLDARISRDRAQRDLEVSILRYLLTTGQLRVAPDGSIRPLAGMEMTEAESLQRILANSRENGGSGA